MLCWCVSREIWFAFIVSRQRGRYSFSNLLKLYPEAETSFICPFHQIWDQSVIRQINNNLSILSLCFLLFHLANNKIPVIAAIHLHLCYSLHVDVTCLFFYDWYIEERYSIDTLLIFGICQCGATMLGDLPIFKLRGRNTEISI